MLPPGVVCDGCNHYFGSKVDGPFANSGAIREARFAQDIPNKRGAGVALSGFLTPGFKVELRRDGVGGVALDAPDEAVRHLLTRRRGTLLVPVGREPDPQTVSRFMAKVALEVVAHRILKAGLPLDELFQPALDPIREHARLGDPRRPWQVASRRIYAPDDVFEDEHGDVYQVPHEFDVLVTEEGDWYVVAALFGVEHAINLGEPSIQGYHRWLAEHDNVSPLYWGTNAKR